MAEALAEDRDTSRDGPMGTFSIMRDDVEAIRDQAPRIWFALSLLDGRFAALPLEGFAEQ